MQAFALISDVRVARKRHRERASERDEFKVKWTIYIESSYSLPFMFDYSFEAANFNQTVVPDCSKPFFFVIFPSLDARLS